MKFAVVLLAIVLCVAQQDAQAADTRDSVVKIFTTSNPIDLYRPWQSKGTEGATGSGCIIDGDMILTNAHVVSDHTFIQVKRNSDPRKYTAKLVAIAHDCDLALLKVEDKSFFENVKSLEIGDLPNLQDTVNVFGFPVGGEEISITEGVVSRIEVTHFVHSFRQLLTVQIDAAINPGNSGGPVIQDNKLVGIVMQTIPDADNIGYIIPTPIIRHFLKDLEDGNYDGFPSLGIYFVNTENAALRAKYGIDDKDGGVLVTSILPYHSAYEKLQEEDIILAIDEVPIGKDGTFEFRKGERLFLSDIVSQKQVGEPAELTIIRDGREESIKISLMPLNTLVPLPYLSSMTPPYYIYGGMVFTTLTTELFKEWYYDMSQYPYSFLYYLISKGLLNEEARKDVVILLNVLPDDINTGYHNFTNLVVKKVNGKKVKSFKEFVLILNAKNGKYTTIETENKTRIVLKNEGIDEVNLKIIERNHIPEPYSENVGSWID